ncbi:MAG: 30S ribosomal protein S12 methylthiotransferase RimO [Candidatus Binataceae bacterium]
MEKVHFLTLGCPKNLADSELMLGALVRAGFELVEAPEDAQVMVVNTCAFIEAAKKESLDAILAAAELKKLGAGRRLVVAGCMAQRYGAELREELPEVDVFVGTGNFLELPELLRRTETPELRPIPYPGGAHFLASGLAPRLRTGDFFSAYLKLSEGCNHKCAFCIIPKIRGRHESRRPADILTEARALARDGVRELNLIAQDLTAYGRDLNPPVTLAKLLGMLAAVQGIRWIRPLYCYPNFVTDELLETIAGLPQVVKYIDIPLQHADDDVLRAMRRERSGNALRKLLDRIRRRIPGVAIRTSFIVGFPSESEHAFANLCDFVHEQQFDRVGVFTYSREENTAAYDLPGQLPARVKRSRRAALMEAQADISLRKNRALIGNDLEVMVEGPLHGGAMRSRGRSAAQAPEIDGMVSLRGEAHPGEFVRARVSKALSYDLHADVIGAIA